MESERPFCNSLAPRCSQHFGQHDAGSDDIGGTFQFGCSPAGDLLTIEDELHRVTRWNYDRYGRPTNKIDQASQEIERWTYNAARATSVWTPGSTTFAHDANGNLTSNGRRTFDYDARNRLVRVSVAGQWKSDFVYDGLGRLRVRTEAAWAGNWETNAVARLRSADGTPAWQPSRRIPAPSEMPMGLACQAAARVFASEGWSQWSGLNRRPTVYETVALPLSYTGPA